MLVLANASSFIMAHNHPSDLCLPSEQDLILTRKIHQLGQMIQIPLNDHLILTSNSYFSMADHGYFLRWRKKKSGLWIY
jgi:DNA repair protein RadC